MIKNTQVETTKKGQATNKNNTPAGKVKTLKSAEERRKAREEQFRNFRINALRRRCARMKMSDEDTEKYVKKLIEQMDSPKEYTIMVMFDTKDFNLMKEAVTNAKINYNILVAGNSKTRVSIGYMSLTGNQEILGKLREIAPPSAKIYPYAKKMESVLPKQEKEVIKKPSNNTAEAKKNAKAARKALNLKRGAHKVHKGKSAAKAIKRKSLAELKKQRKATTVQLKDKNASTGSKKASTPIKKAA